SSYQHTFYGFSICLTAIPLSTAVASHGANLIPDQHNQLVVNNLRKTKYEMETQSIIRLANSKAEQARAKSLVNHRHRHVSSVRGPPDCLDDQASNKSRIQCGALGPGTTCISSVRQRAEARVEVERS